MSSLILLDAGPLGLVTNPKMQSESRACYQWMQGRIAAGNIIVVPEIADYEVRRELIRVRKKKGLERLDTFKSSPLIRYEPLSALTMLKAAEFWAMARQKGKPTADPKALDGDVILAAQAALLGEQGHDTIVATTNVGHLSLFVPAQHWKQIT